MAESCEKLLVIEEGYPIMEELLKGYLEKEEVHGRLDGTLPRDGELNPDWIAKAFRNTRNGRSSRTGNSSSPRPPRLMRRLAGPSGCI